MAATPPARTSPFREDFWSEDATWTLVDAWGTRCIDLFRENLQQKDWQSVADAVNAIHGHDPRRTDVQCKNRIDTLKKKYEAEKARAMDSPDGSFVSTWPFYTRMDELIGSLVSAKKPSPPSVPLSSPTTIPLLGYRRPVSAVAEPVVRLPQKRPAPGPASAVDNSYFRRNYSAVAAAAAAEVEEDDDLEDSESEEVEEATDGDGATRLAKAVERLAETYARVGREQQNFEIELEKIRMQFDKDMEVQRMQFFMELEKIMMATEAKQPDSNVCDGPATVGGIQDGDFKIGDSAGTIDNITQCKLYSPGSVGFVPKSEFGGDGEKIQAIRIKGEGITSSDGEKIQAIRIKGEGTTSSDGEKIQAIRIKGEGTTSSP